MHTNSFKQSIQLVVVLFTLLIAGNGNMRGQGTLVQNAIVNPSFEEARTVTNGDGTVFRTPVGWQTLRQGTLQQYSPNPGDPCYAGGKSDDHYAKVVTPAEGLAGVIGGTSSDYEDLGIDWSEYGVDGERVCLYPGIWQWSWDGIAGIKQTIASLPAGTYTLTAIMGGKMKSARTDVDARWILGLGVLKGSDAAAVAVDSLSVNEERPVLADGLGITHSVTFTVNGTEDITIKAYAHSTENAWEPLMFWCDNVQLFYHGNRTDVTGTKLNNPSFENSSNNTYKTVQPVPNPTITGWSVSKTGNGAGATYTGVVRNGTGNRYGNYSKLGNLGAQAGNNVLLVRKSNENSTTKSCVDAENTTTFGAESHVTLTTTTKSLDVGHYECTIRFKLADFGGAQAQIGLTATPQHGDLGTTGLLWGQTNFWTCTGITFEANHPLAQTKANATINYTTSTWGSLEWKSITTNFEVTAVGTATIQLDLLLPAGDARMANGVVYSSRDAWFQDWQDTYGDRWAYGTEALIDNLTLTKVDIKPILPEDGEYYLYNPETEQYLSTHGGANYGTQAMMDDVGLNVDLMPYTDNAIAVGTKIANGAGNDRLFVDNNAGVFCDGGSSQYLTLERTGALQTYYLKNNNKYITAHVNAAPTGEDTPSDASKWVLKSYRQRVEDMWRMKPGDAAMDATFLIQCPDFGYRDQRWSDGAWTTWAEDGGTDAIRTYGENGTGASQYRRGGNISNYIVENWHRRPHVYQTIQSRDANVALPAGVYTLTAQGFDGENGTSSYLYIKDENNSDLSDTRVALPKLSDLGQTFGVTAFIDGDISNWFAGDKTRALVTAETYVYGNGGHTPTPGGDGDFYPVRFTIGIQNTGLDQWTVFDNFRLTYRPFSAADVTAEAAQAEALKLSLTNKGTGDFQINPATEPHCVAITQAATNTATTTNPECRNSLVALAVASKGFREALADPGLFKINTPDATKQYNIANVSDGYAFKDNQLTFKSMKNAASSNYQTDMAWDEPAGSIYPQGVTFEPVDETTNKYRLSYLRADGQRIYVGTGVSTGIGANENQLRPTTNPENALTVQIVAQTDQDGHWWLRNTRSGNRRIGGNGSDNAGFYTSDSDYGTFYHLSFPEAATKPSASVSVSDVYKFSTLMLPFDAELPEGVTAYTVKGTLSDKTIALQRVGRNVQANVPYVIYAENGLSATTLSGFGKAYTDDTQNDEQLTGTFFGQEDGRDIYVPKDCYVLSVKNYSGENRVAFYRVTEENTVRLPKYRAYYTHKDFAAVAPSPAPARASAYGFTILDDNKTPADIITLVNIILRKDNKESAPRFVQRADGKVVYTDINGDGEVTLADVTALVNMMHGK